ncbi:MAG TPA: tetratricopeptide repeat protein [Thermoanaerobaculia bacterium]|jgi:tetratricopeptide (TPR) repeat protein|nr:tetratricopeptide repeat protein [Thermoanaerobaculia bacterium]
MLKTLLLLALMAADLKPIPHPSLSGLDPEVAAQLQDARALVDGLMTQQVPPEELTDTYGELCRLYHAYGFLDSAAPCYANVVQLAPRDFRWSYYLGRVLQDQGKLAESEGAYRRALDLQPAYVPAKVHLGEILLAGNRTDEAEAVLGQALAADAKNAAAEAALGEVFLSRRQYAEAARHLEAALAAAPAADRLHHPLGLAYRGLGDMDKAREHLEKAGKVGVKPADPLTDEMEALRQGSTVHTLRGRVAFRFGRYQDAAAEFRKAVEAQPDSVPARINLAAALAEAGDRKGAVEQLREALRLAPGNATAHFNLGTLMALEGQAAGAVVHLQEAVRIDPNDAPARIALAEVLAKDGRPGEALAQYEKAVGLAPQEERGWLGEAGLLVDLGRLKEAKDVLETAYGNLPTSGLIAHAFARFLASCPDLSLREGRRAVELASKVYTAMPTSTHAETAALALAEAGNCENAAEWQKKAIEAARKEGPPERIKEMEADLKRYEAGGACRP